MTAIVLPIEVRLVELASGEVIEAEKEKPEEKVKGIIRPPVFA